MSENSRVSRRNFIKAAGLGASSAALGATLITNAAAEEFQWDHTADVIAVGSGGAALAGAAGAIDNGATVLVLEKGPVIGGTTAKSGGGAWVPNNHHQRASGISDDRDVYLKYCARVAFPELYRENSPVYGLPESTFRLLEANYDNAARIFEHLDAAGAFPSTLAMSWDGKPSSDYHGQLPENGDIKGRHISPRMADGSEGRGANLVSDMSDYIRERGGVIHTGHRVTRILTNEDGRVIGVEAEAGGETKRFLANKGVIFGTGGFTHNPHMRSNYLRTPILGGCAVPTNQGDLILMASEVGAKFGNLNEAWNQQVVLEEVLSFSSVPSGVFFLGGDSSIAVNKFGKRMYDEKYVYPERTRSHQAYDIYQGDYPNLYQIFIFDEKCREFGGMLIPGPDADLPGYVITGDTLEELTDNIQARFDQLADKIGPYPLDETFLEGLRETIATYNGYAETGVDTEFHRGEAPVDSFFHPVPIDRGYPNPYMAPISDTGPYYAILLGAGALDTKGGPVFNEHGQVVNIHDEPIPGFYVAGNAGASPSGKSYLGAGGTLGLGMTFGYLAGEHAATQG